MRRARVGFFATVTLAALGCNPLDPLRVLDDAQRVALVKIAPDSVNKVVGDTVTFTVTVNGANNTPIMDRRVTWSVGNPIVASVSDSGVVTARAAGRSEILASVDNYRVSGILVVTAPPAPSPAPLRQP